VELLSREFPVSEYLVFGVLVLAFGVVVLFALGGAVVSYIDRRDQRQERRRLTEENKTLTTDNFRLQGEKLILEAKLLAALEQIQTLSASLSPGPPE
jgi:hypothetical protein